jgi:hypothetical protein
MLGHFGRLRVQTPRMAPSSRARCMCRRALPGASVPFRDLSDKGEISLTDLCDRPYSQGPVKQNGRAFALLGTDELSAAGLEGLQGNTPAEQVRWLRHSATVSNLQSGSCGAYGRRAGTWLVFRGGRLRSTLRAATRSRAPYFARFPTDTNARRYFLANLPAKQL